MMGTTEELKLVEYVNTLAQRKGMVPIILAQSLCDGDVDKAEEQFEILLEYITPEDGEERVQLYAKLIEVVFPKHTTVTVELSRPNSMFNRLIQKVRRDEFVMTKAKAWGYKSSRAYGQEWMLEAIGGYEAKVSNVISTSVHEGNEENARERLQIQLTDLEPKDFHIIVQKRNFNRNVLVFQNRGRLYEQWAKQACLRKSKAMASLIASTFLKDPVRTQSEPINLLWWVVNNSFSNLIWCLIHGQPDRFEVSSDTWALVLCHASADGHKDVVEKLLTWDDLDVNFSHQLYTRGRTALHCAAAAGHVGVVKLLCRDKARIRAHEEAQYGETQLELAIRNKHKNIQKILLGMPEVAKRVDQMYRDRQVLVDAANAMLVGAALIGSVTFAGWLQPPLGYTPYYEFPQPSPAPPNSYESYVSIQGHKSIQFFAVFNSLSFFFAIGTVIAAADAAYPLHGDTYIGRSVKSLRFSLKWATCLFIVSVICVLGAFASAGIAILPPIDKFGHNMITTIVVGTIVCAITLAKLLLFRLPTDVRDITILCLGLPYFVVRELVREFCKYRNCNSSTN